VAAPEQFQIQRAERKQARLRMALCGASGAGKTWNALLLARGLVEELLARQILQGTLEGKIGMIDTERRSGSLFAHLVPFDTIDRGPPYSVDRYIGALNALERAGCAVVILDSISHAWASEGGVLALLDAFEDRQRFSAFGTAVNPAQDRFVDAMLRSPCHIVATMRSKTAWVLEQKDRGGRMVNVPKRIGMAPVQRPGIEYEFTTLLELDTSTHLARPVKNRCPVFEDGKEVRVSAETGRALAAWLLEAAPAPEDPVSGTPAERIAAVYQAGLRAMERVENGPDLARVYNDTRGSLAGFAPAVPLAEVNALLADLATAKDVRKVALGLAPSPTGRPIESANAPAVEAPKEQLPLAQAHAQRTHAPTGSKFDDMADDVPF